jgi:hypothetical protein
MDETEIVVVGELPEDPGDVVFDEHGTPMLVWQQYPIGRRLELGWVLTYLEPDGNGVEGHYIGGQLEDVDDALEQAREHLRWAWSAGGRP